MKNVRKTYGAASLGGQLLIARVENDGARTIVTALLTSDDDLGNDSLNSGKLFINAGDHLALFKRIQITQNPLAEAEEQVRFEMARSLLDGPECFYFDVFPIDDDDNFRRYLAIAYHRREIDQRMADYAQKLRQPSGFKLDAVALAAGYLNFCRVEPGDLQLLVNIEPEAVVLAIIYRQQLRSIGRLDTPPGEEISVELTRRLAGELKMTIAYHLAELFQEGITIPPSRIILSGRLARNQIVRTALADQITTEISLPNINRSIFQPAEETIDRHPAERFLIPLGLAVP